MTLSQYSNEIWIIYLANRKFICYGEKLNLQKHIWQEHIYCILSQIYMWDSVPTKYTLKFDDLFRKDYQITVSKS